VKDAFAAAPDSPVERAVLLAGGASKEAWAVDSEGRQLLIRRAAGGVIHQGTLTLEHEFEVLRAAHEAGVKVPEPIAYLGEVEGREAFVMERIKGETIGRRIVKNPPAGLDLQLAQVAPVEQAGQAIADLGERRAQGKIVVTASV